MLFRAHVRNVNNELEFETQRLRYANADVVSK